MGVVFAVSAVCTLSTKVVVGVSCSPKRNNQAAEIRSQVKKNEYFF